MKNPISVGCLLVLCSLASFVCNAQDVWASSFQSPQSFQVASDILSTVDKYPETQQMGLGLSTRQLVDGSSLGHVPHDETFSHCHRRKGFPMNRVQHRQSVERGSDDRQESWVSRDQFAQSSPVAQVLQAQVPQAQSSPVAQVPQAQSSPVAQVPQAQSSPVEQVASEALAPVDQDQQTWHTSHGLSSLEGPHQLVGLAPVIRFPHGHMDERLTHHQLGGDGYHMKRVPHSQSVEQRFDERQVDWAPRDRLEKPVFHGMTADSMVSSLVYVPQPLVAQSAPEVQIPQAQPVGQAPVVVPVVQVPQMLAQFPPVVQVSQDQQVGQFLPVVQAPQPVAQFPPVVQVSQDQPVGQFPPVVQAPQPVAEFPPVVQVSQDQPVGQFLPVVQAPQPVAQFPPVVQVSQGQFLPVVQAPQPVAQFPPVVQVSQGQFLPVVQAPQPVAQFPPVVQVSQDQPVGQFPPVVQAPQPVAQFPPVVQVSQDQPVGQFPPVVQAPQPVAQFPPVVQVSQGQFLPVVQAPQPVAQFPPVVQVSQDQPVGQFPPVVQAPQPVAEFPPVVQVSQDQPVGQFLPVIQAPQPVAQFPPVVQVSQGQFLPVVQAPQPVAQFPPVAQVSQDQQVGQFPPVVQAPQPVAQFPPVVQVSQDQQVGQFPPVVQAPQPVAQFPPVVQVLPVVQAPQPVAQFPPVVQVSQDQQVGQFFPVVQAPQPVAQFPPVVQVSQDQPVAQFPPVVQAPQPVAQFPPVQQATSEVLSPVGQNQEYLQLGHLAGLEAPYQLNLAHRQSDDRVSDDWQVDWFARGQLEAQDLHTRTADSRIPPVIRVSHGQQQTVAQSLPVASVPQAQPVAQSLPVASVPQAQPVAQSPPVASVAQAQPVLQSPLESPMVTYTRPLVRSVAADCRENSVLVVVKRDLLGIGQLIRPSDVTLGGCAPTGQDNTAGVLMFQVPLQSCGSTRTMRADALVYTFTLLYMPHALGSSPVVRTNGAAVSVECRYLRLHNVSSSAIRPTWVPFLAARHSEDRLVFSLKLMSDDWRSQRASNTYFLGDLINIEASVSVAHHVPLRVFVDGCVATLVPNVKADPRYAFIENHGCLVDAKLTGSRSQFLRRRQPDKLQFQLDAFRFSGDPRSSIYLTCLLKATPAAAETNFEYKACSFVANRWVAAGGHERVCGCCDASCSERRERNQADEFKGEALLGPVIVHEFVKGGRN